MNFDSYDIGDFYDELFDGGSEPRDFVAPLIEKINTLSKRELKRRRLAADTALKQQGITFSVYGDKQGIEKIFPFDIIPRVIPGSEWDRLERGLKQRIKALNLFIDDVYNDQRIFRDKIVPKTLIKSSSTYLKECEGLRPPKGIWIHITGTDLVRDKDGEFYVLEDNLRCPSGVSYVLENRAILKRTFPDVFHTMKVRRVAEYPDQLYEALRYLAPESRKNPNIVVLTPGIYNSAYFEHTYLAQEMGVTLAQGSDLTVIDDEVMLRTTKGFRKVDVIYRRIDDDFLDPQVFNSNSVLGVPGLMDAYYKGNVALANAPGTGIADDKAVYAYVPQIIKYYLGEEAIIPNVPTYLCDNKKDREYVLENIKDLVIKAVDQSGGYGMLIGPKSKKKEREEFKEKIKANPRAYIAQPTLALSRSPTIIEEGIEGRHVDIRPYILYGKDIFVTPGGLTRVALVKDSLVVNSSQGGGSKDTWVLEGDEALC